jgi:hypothetical protein
MKGFLDRFEAGLLLFGAMLVAVFCYPLSETHHAAIINGAEVASSGLATAMLLVVARRFGEDEDMRYWWALLAAGMFCNSMGFVIYGALGYPSTETEVFPTEADPWWVLTYPFLVIGSWLMRRTYLDSGLGLERSRWVLALAAAVTLLIGGYFVWPILVNPAESLYETLILCAYPLGDALVLATALSIVSILRQFGAARVAWPWWWLTAGWVCVAAADLTYTHMSNNESYVTGTLPDLLWMLQGWFISWGAYRQYRLLEPITALAPPAPLR